MNGYILAILLLQPAPTPWDSLEAPSWTRLPERPSNNQLECVPYREDFWSVALIDGAVMVRARSTSRVVEALPFKYSPQMDQRGDRRVLQVSDGWLVGFDAGEFGGGLWWFGQDGQASRRLRPLTGAPAHAADPFRAENVLGFTSLGGQTLVLMGLDHLSRRSGRAFGVNQDTGGNWQLVPVAVFDGSAEAWLAEDERLYVITEGGLWTLKSDGRVKQWPGLDLGPVGPADSLVRATDGALYVGLRHYVLRLEETGGVLDQTWFAPSDCLTLRMRERYECAARKR